MTIRRRWKTRLSAAVLGLTLCTAAPVLAQDSPFSPRMIINDRVISNYELDQRIQFMRLLRTPGDLDKLALQALMDDRLRVQEAEKLELSLTEAEVQAGMTEFAGRVNLPLEQFVKILGSNGVEPETFRDFVSAGLIWRQVVRAKFGAQANVTNTDIDRAITNMGKVEGVQILMSEIIIPAPPGREDEVMELAQRLSLGVAGEDAFASAAREYSASGSKGRGGRLDWVPLANLPAAIAKFVLGLSPGETSAPVPIPGAVALFQLRGIIEDSTEAPAATQVEYAQLALPNDASFAGQLARIRGNADACNDLYGLFPTASAEQLQRLTQTMAEVPQDVGLALALLDQGEISADITRGDTRLVLMMCLRTPLPKELPEPAPVAEGAEPAPPGPNRDAIRENLINQKLGAVADNYLADLRANAIIREP